MKWLVTGATGLVGNNVVRQLVARGDKVRALARATSDPRALEGLPVEVVCGDVLQQDSIHGALAGVDCVVHAAAIVHIGWKMAQEQRTINVEGTRNIAVAARKFGTKLIHVSTIDALGVDPQGRPVDENSTAPCPVLCPYVVTKRDSERIVQEQTDDGLCATIVNPGFMVGPWDWKPSSGQMLLEVAKGRTLLAPPGSNSYCDVRDVAAAIIEAGKKEKMAKRYILAGPSLSYFDAWKIFAEVTGGRPPLRQARKPVIRLVGGIADFFGWIRNKEGKVNSAATEMSLLTKNYSSEKAQRELGYRCRPLDQSAKDAWDWFQEHGYAGTHSRSVSSL
jgi:dihydroflavonol-4-reductase